MLDLDEIEKRYKAATAGAWDACPMSGSRRWIVFAVNWGRIFLDATEEDAKFCAHARTDIPALTKEVRERYKIESMIKDCAFTRGTAPTTDDMAAALLKIGADPLLHDVFNFFVSYARNMERDAK